MKTSTIIGVMLLVGLAAYGIKTVGKFVRARETQESSYHSAVEDCVLEGTKEFRCEAELRRMKP